jgi:glycyl-tRNA synthetase beta chain
MAQPRRSVGRRRNLLIEIGTEELPPKALRALSESFAASLYGGLVEAGVVEDAPGRFKNYATPRRLAVWVQGVLPKQPDQVEDKRGPAIQAAFDSSGNPTPAAEGFARSCGVSVSKLRKTVTEKGSWLTYQRKVKGERLQAIMKECLAASVKGLPIPRRMRWGDSEEEFVRPVHWLLALYGSDLVKTEVLGLKSNRFTRGHRFHCPDMLRVPSADRYVSTLKTSGYVLADYDTRRSLIEKQVNRLARKEGGRALIAPSLLDEVTGLVEWPVSLLGSFEEKYLKLPREVLVSTMEDHQKYFSITSDKGRPMPMFIAVSNIKSKSPKRVRQGNERVLRARLSDAEFFWNTDQKKNLEERIEELRGVLFHFRLGSIYDRTMRLEKLSKRIARRLAVDQQHAAEAARLCKTDLVTDMVGEFPDLQGVIGRYYAINQGLDRTVADAIDGHYLPRFSGDSLPVGGVAQSVAIADRIDILTGIFACGEIPTGDKDPFGLRRAALGVLRILIEGKIDLDLRKLIDDALLLYSKSGFDGINTGPEVSAQVFDYTIERLRGYFQSLGHGTDVYAAVAAVGPTRPLDFYLRVKALDQFFSKRKGAADSLASANKRIANILAKSGAGDIAKFDRKLATEKEEIALAGALAGLRKQVSKEFSSGSYDKGLKALAGLRSPVDAFFDRVMVMDENPAVRSNRLALLSEIRGLFLRVGDISRVRVES